MARWYRVALNDEDLATGREMALQREFEELFIRAKTPDDAAMFTSEDDLPPYLYFFSPAAGAIATDLIRRHAGIECDPPARADVSLVVGNQNWRRIFFSGEQ